MRKTNHQTLLELQDLLIRVQLSARNEAHSQTLSDFDDVERIRHASDQTSKTSALQVKARQLIFEAVDEKILSFERGHKLSDVFIQAAKVARESQEIFCPWDDSSPFLQALRRNWKPMLSMRSPS